MASPTIQSNGVAVENSGGGILKHVQSKRKGIPLPQDDPDEGVDDDSSAGASMLSPRQRARAASLSVTAATRMYKPIERERKTLRIQELCRKIMAAQAANRLNLQIMDDTEYDKLYADMLEMDPGGRALEARERALFVRILQGTKDPISNVVGFAYGLKAAAVSKYDPSGYFWHEQSWGDLKDEDKRRCEALGWTQETFDGGDYSVLPDEWAQLGGDTRKAALELGYSDAQSWKDKPDPQKSVSCRRGTGTLIIWDTRTGEHLPSPKELRSPVAAVGHDGDGTAVTVSTDGKLRVWDAKWDSDDWQLKKQRDGSDAVFDHEYPASSVRVLSLQTASRNRDLGGTHALLWNKKSLPRLVSLDTGKPYELTAPDEETFFSYMDIYDNNGKGWRAVGCSAGPPQVMIWDLSAEPREDNGPVLQLEHHDTVNFVEIFSKGRRALTCCKDWTLHVWNVDVQGDQSNGCMDVKLRHIAELSGHEGKVNSCVVLRGGKSALSCSDDGTMRIWDISDGWKEQRCRQILRSEAALEADSVRTGIWARQPGDDQDDIERVQSLDKELRLRADAKELRREFGSKDLAGDKEYAKRVLQSSIILRQGRPMPSGSELDGMVGDLQQCWRELKQGAIRRCAVFTKSHTAVSCHNDGKMRVWDLADGECFMTLEGHTKPITRCQLLDQYGRFISASDDGTVRLWDLAARKRTHRLPNDCSRIECCALFDGGRKVLTAGEKELRVWDLITSSSVKLSDDKGRDGHADDITTCAVSSFTSLHSEHLESGPIAVSFSATTVCRWDLKEKTLLKCTPHSYGAVWGYVPFCKGTKALVAYGDDYREPKLVITDSIVFSPDADCPVQNGHLSAVVDGKWYAHGEIPRKDAFCAKVFEAEEEGARGQKVRVWKVISHLKSNELCLWDLTTQPAPSAEGLFTNHQDEILTYAVSDTGTKVVSTSNDYTLQLWRVSDRQQLFRMHLSIRIRYCEVISDQACPHVLGCVEDGTVRVWKLEMQDEVAAKRLVPSDQCELVASRGRYCEAHRDTKKQPARAENFLKNSVSCVAISRPASFAVNDPLSQPRAIDGLQVVVGRADGSLQVVDMARAESNVPCARTLWDELPMEHTKDDDQSWRRLMLRAVEQTSPHILYQPDRDHRNFTLLHKLAGLDGGVGILREIDQHGKMMDRSGNPGFENLGHCTAMKGLVSRAGKFLAVDLESELLCHKLGDHVATLRKLGYDDPAKWQLLAGLCRRTKISTENICGQTVDVEYWGTELLKLKLLPADDDFGFVDSDGADGSCSCSCSGSDAVTPEPEPEQEGTRLTAHQKAAVRELVPWIVEKAPLRPPSGGSTSPQRKHFSSALALALDYQQEDFVRVLLEDYCDAAKSHLSKAWANANLLPQHDIVLALQIYPKLTADFIMQLQYTRTKLLSSRPAPRCEMERKLVVRLDGSASPIEVADGSASPLEVADAQAWWDSTLTEIWESSATKSKTKKHRRDDTGWGSPVYGALVPIDGMTERTDLLQQKKELPFSDLLAAAVKHAEREESADLFNSDTITAIVEHKWLGSSYGSMPCQEMFVILTVAYAVHLIVLTVLVLRFDGAQWDAERSAEETVWFPENAIPFIPDSWFPDSWFPRNTGNSNQFSWEAAACYASSFYTVLLGKREIHQIYWGGVKGYITDHWNIIDLLSVCVTLYVLFLIRIKSAGAQLPDVLWSKLCDHDGDHDCRSHVRTWQAIALLTSWVKVLYFMRGYEFSGFVVHMLSTIVWDMRQFSLVLLFIMIA